MIGDTRESELAQLGLTPDEARAYLALLSRGRLTVGELRSATGITRGRIYQVASALVEKGAALEAVSKVRAFEPADPQIAMANLLEKRQRELRELESVADHLARSLSRHSRTEPTSPNFIESLRHRASIGERVAQLEDAAEREILMFSRPPYYSVTKLIDNEGEYQALKRGVSVRCVYESSALANPEDRAAITSYVQTGEIARHAPSVPTKLAIFDRSTAVFQLADPVDLSNFVTLVFRHPDLCELLVHAFERVWDSSEPIPLDDKAEPAAL